MADDTPRMWIDDEPKYDPETGEIIEDTSAQTNIVPVEDIPLPTTAEQSEIIAKSELSEDNKKLLNSIVELNAICDVMQQTYISETQEKQKQAIQLICTNFLAQRFRNNQTAEQLKQALLTRLLNNIENLDLATTAQIYNDLHDVTNQEAVAAISQLLGGGAAGIPGTNGGISLTINNATAEGSQITTNTLNAQPQQVQQLKEVAALNTSIRAWSGIPGKKQPMQAQIVDSTQKQS